MDTHKPLEDKRLILSIMSETDFHIFFPLMNCPEVLDSMVLDFPLDRNKFYYVFKKSPVMAAEGDEYNFVITHKGNGEKAGMCVLLDINREKKNAELGYWIKPGLRRQGIAFDACKLVINFAFTELKLHKVWAETFKTNKPSRILLKKLGFRKVGLKKQEVFKHGKWQDRVCYELLGV